MKEKLIQEKSKGDLQLLNHRLLHFGVTYGDLMSTTHKPPNFLQWGMELGAIAENYDSKGDQCWADKKVESAAHYWRLASTYYHFAQSFFLTTLNEKELFRKYSRKAFEKMATLINPSAQFIKIKYDDHLIPGYLRIAYEGAPLVIFVNGLDSSKEVELFYFSEYFLKRGISVFCFDGPGQGELLDVCSMLKDNFENAVSCVIDSLKQRPDVANEAIGIFGVSFGGYLAPRCTAHDSRIKACISLCGPYDYKLAYCPPIVIDGFKAQYNLCNALDMNDFKELISLSDIQDKLNTPTLIVIGEQDHLMNEYQKTAMENLPSGEKVVIRVPNGEHVCSSRHSELLPTLADWMFDKLQNTNQ